MSTINCSRRPKRSYWFAALVLCLVARTAADATQISLDLGPSHTVTSHVATTFNDLNGTHLQGQTLSLDWVFSGGKFARLFSVTNPSFAILLTLNTSGSGVVGFLDGTAYLLNQNGSGLGSPEVLGSASGDDGSLSVALFPLLSGQFSTPLDFFGMHTELLFPTNGSITVTGGQLQLVSAGAPGRDVFGIGPGIPRDIVPDSGSTLLLCGVTLLALVGFRRHIPTARTISQASG